MKNIRKLFCVVIVVFICAMPVVAQTPTLKFNAEGKFKIVQFTDVHWIYNNPASDKAGERIREVLDIEKPDLVVFTGDLVFAKPAKEALNKILEPLIERSIPYAITWGNHDDEQDLNRKELSEYVSTKPFNLTSTTEGISGETNYALEIASADKSHQAAILYIFDSHSYSKVKGIKGYDWIKVDQIAWYKRLSDHFSEQNGGKILPSLAFFHIPLPEFHEAVADEGAMMVGTRKERACAPALNSGLGTALIEQGDVMGVFVGHDHVNDYAVNWRGIMLCYGRYTGGNTVYNDIPQGNGARVIELTEGKRKFRSWIRIKGGKKINELSYPADLK